MFRTIDVDIDRLYAFDTETYLFRPGDRAPRMVCASTSASVGARLFTPDEATKIFRTRLTNGDHLALANAAYDLCVLAQKDPSLLPLIFKALREGRIHDVLIAEALNAIYYGNLGKDPKTGDELRSPSTNKVTKRYSLELTLFLTLGRKDAKANDAWRKSYALLDGIPFDCWPETARVYPVDDARNTRDVAVVQIVGRTGNHKWGENGACEHCNLSIPFGEIPPCPKAPPEPHKNLFNLPAQVEADFSLKANACWGLRTDPERVEKLAVEVEEKNKKFAERFKRKGWLREDGSEDQRAVKKAIAHAFGAVGLCETCLGTGTVPSIVWIDCRGVKSGGRYQGCPGAECSVCRGLAKIEKRGKDITCKNVFDAAGVLVTEGCDGTGYDLGDVKLLPRTEKLGVKTDRDTCAESGDDDLADYGQNEFEKSLSTYLPYLRTGIDRPLNYDPNVLVVTGRCSVENSPLHQMPRDGHERECIRARGSWCGSEIEYILGSTDYEAGELCTLAQYNHWLFGYSRMRDVINATGKPGILHSDLAAEVMGISLEDFLVRLKAGDKQAKEFRQAVKPISFGKPGKMGVPKLVLTNRKKNAGFTVCENGPARNSKGQPGYWGIRFCILTGGARSCGNTKIYDWKGYPCAPVCKACVDVVDRELSPAYLRRYPEMKDYFEWARRRFEDGQLSQSVVWDRDRGAPVVIRERKCEHLTDFCNNPFQSMLSDIGKHAYVTATRECFLGVTDDGKPSPLAGCRLPLYLHDEPLSELVLAMAHVSGPRIAEILMESGRLFAPDVAWRAETALAFWWNKAMEPVYDSFGRLVPWEPIVATAVAA